MARIRSRASALLALAASAALATRAGARPPAADGTLVQFNDNGAWSWFQDERAIIDPNTNQLLISSIASGDGAGGAARDGQVDLVSYNLNSGATSRTQIVDYSFLADDHNSAALLVRPDGRYLAVYTAHQNDNLVRWRVSTNPGDATSWQPQQTFTATTNQGTTYSNVFYLSSTGLTYNYFRANNYDPHLLTSANNGTSWSYSGHLLMDPANSSSQRPYVKYASNGTDRIYFTTTDAHPRDANTGIYAGYMTTDGHLHRIDGTDIGTLATNGGAAVSATAFTTIFAPNTVVNGTTRTRAWTTDLALDSAGNPYTVFTSRVNNADTDHRFYYSRWTGSTFATHEIAKAGSYLYAAENDYTGLAALSPHDANTLYISTKIDPRDGTTTTNKYEIFRGFTTDTGASWTWVPITTGSTSDNLRPIVPKWDSTHTALIWFSGTYTTYQHWNAAVVGKFFTGNNGVWTNGAGGAWDAASNWNDQRVGDGMSFIADFSRAEFVGDVTITDGAPRTIGFLTFGDANLATPSSLTLSGNGTLTLDGGVITPTIQVANQTVTITRPLSANQGLVKTGNGRLVLPTIRTTTLSINGGTVALAPTAGSPSSLGLLSVAPSAVLDVTDNDLIATATPKSSVESMVASKRLASSLATAMSATALGVLDGAEYAALGNSEFHGGAFAPTDVLVKYTWNGDSNLDGRVTFDDYVKIDTGFNTGLTGWLNGDFNYSGAVNFDDYVLIDIAFNQQNGTLARAIDWISGDDRSESGLPSNGVEAVIEHFERFGVGYGQAFLAAVPEPGSLYVMVLASAVSLRRRRSMPTQRQAHF